jgi:hypothetical protein
MSLEVKYFTNFITVQRIAPIVEGVSFSPEVKHFRNLVIFQPIAYISEEVLYNMHSFYIKGRPMYPIRQQNQKSWNEQCFGKYVVIF